MHKRILIPVVLATLVVTASIVWSQPGGRRHVANQTQPLQLVPATEQPPARPQSNIETKRDLLHVAANGIPNHRVGRFPNRGNPNTIRPQRYEFDLPGDPKLAKKRTSIYISGRAGPPNMPFGIAVNGIPFDPGTNEFWQGDRNSGWNYEALGGAVPLGIDENYAHVQPHGAYHYHGIPHGLMKELGYDESKHSPIVGWAADGFPIYCKLGYSDPDDESSRVVNLRSSYRLKKGNRPGGQRGPGGAYDGTFVADYEFDKEAGDLDECNGRFCKTPDFPKGTYAYFLTDDWPVIPRSFQGSPVRFR